MFIKSFFYWICSVVIDFLIVYLFVKVTDRFIPPLGFYYEGLMYSTVFLFYSILSSFNNGKSVGREWMKLKIVDNDLGYSKIKIFIHDFIFQWGVFFILPMCIFKNFTNINILIPLLVIFVGINFLSWLILKISIIELFSHIKLRKQNKVNNKSKINFLLFFSFILDLSIVFSITLLINLFLLQWIFINFIILFLIVCCLYYLLSYIVASRTFGKFFFGLSIKLKSEKIIPFKSLLKRELLFKFGISYIVPMMLMNFLGWNDVNRLITFTTIFNIIIAIVYKALKNELWWNTFANTKYSRRQLTMNENILKYSILLFFLGFVYVVMLKYNNYDNNTKQNFLGFNFPFKKNEYPNNRNVKKYIDFLSENELQDPKDYILRLFDENDIVIICENNHLEDTQWDLIYSVVSDSVFINEIGNVFTEYGNIKNQPKVDKFLKTTYHNDTSRYKCAATLMPYRSGGFYNFVNNLNKLNESLSDSLKVNLFFTDILPWSYLIYEKPPIEQLILRDSLMASVVIDWYQKTKKKCLVVTNYRHAFILNDEKIEQESYKLNQSILQTHFGGNEAQYIFNKFPKNTTNVMIYGDAFNFLFLPAPIQNGKWRTALSSLSKPVGFNFDKSPFGEDLFDFYPMKGRRMNVKYKDVFNGFVFYSDKENHKFSSQLYSNYAAQQEYHEIVNKVNIDKNTLIERLEKYDDYKDRTNYIIFDIYLNWHYYIDIVLFIILASISLLILIIDLLFRIMTRRV